MIKIWRANTDDVRGAPVLCLIDKLLDSGASLHLHDPAAMSRIEEKYGERVRLVRDPYQCLSDAEALIIVTEWGPFKNPDYDKMKSLMRQPVICDGRNIYYGQNLAKKGFKYFGVGV